MAKIRVLKNGARAQVLANGKLRFISGPTRGIGAKTKTRRRRSTGASTVAKKSKSYSKKTPFGKLAKYVNPLIQIGGGVLGAVAVNEISKRQPSVGPKVATVAGAALAILGPKETRGVGVGAATVGGFLVVKDGVAQMLAQNGAGQSANAGQIA